MLLVVAAKVVNEAAHRERAVALEHRRALQLRIAQAGDDLHRLDARHAEVGQHFPRVGRAVVALDGQRLAVDGCQRRMGFGKGAAKAHVVALDLDVAHMAELLDGGEGLAGHALPRGRRPVPVGRGNGRVVGLQLRREGRECAEGRGVHVFSEAHYGAPSVK
jgi:hypothetical protein